MEFITSEFLILEAIWRKKAFYLYIIFERYARKN